MYQKGRPIYLKNVPRFSVTHLDGQSISDLGLQPFRSEDGISNQCRQCLGRV